MSTIHAVCTHIDPETPNDSDFMSGVGAELLERLVELRKKRTTTPVATVDNQLERASRGSDVVFCCSTEETGEVNPVLRPMTIVAASTFMAMTCPTLATGTVKPSRISSFVAARTASGSILEDANRRSTTALEGDVMRMVASRPEWVCSTVVSTT